MLALVCLLGAGLVPGAFAQGVTTAAISGVVTDAQGEALPGVNVVAVHEPTGTTYGVASRVDGRYSLQALRVGGPYTVTVSYIGFATERRQNINLALGQNLTLDFTLRDEAIEAGEIEVVGISDPLLNGDRTGASTNISEQTIERLPTISRSLADFARLTPQSTGGSSLAGRNNRYNNIQIDGATLNDVFGLSGTGAPGGQAGAQPIGLDAIQEFNVDIAPYDIRNSGFTGGQINAITRSGTNRFEGSLYYLGRNEAFVGDLQRVQGGQDVSLPFDDFSESFTGFRLGGPIVKNKVFFFVNGELRRRSDPLSAGVNGSNAAVQFALPADSLQRIIDIAKNQYGYDAGGFDSFSQDENSTSFLAKLDWNINPNNRLTLRHNYVDADDDTGVSRSATGFDLSNRKYVFASTQNSTVAQLNTTFGAQMFNEARLVYTRIRDSRDVVSNPFPYVNIDVANPADPTSTVDVYLGIDRFSQANSLDQDLFEFTDNFTWINGNHNLLLGTSNQLFRFTNLFIQDYYGGYEFDSINDFAAGNARRYYLSYSQVPGEDTPVAEFTALQLGAYVQDIWTVSPGLKLTLGLRADMPLVGDEPLASAAAEEAFGRSTQNIATGNILLSPRAGFNYDVRGDQKTQVRGGVGIFSGRTPFVWISNQFSNTGVDFARVDERNVGFFVPSANPADQVAAAQLLPTGQTSEINLMDEDFKFPQVVRTNLAFDQRLPFFGLTATLEGIYSKTMNDITYENLNAVQTGTSAYGRPIYGARRDPRFTNALLLKNTDEGYDYSLTAQLQRRATMGLDGSVSYTYNRAENVNNGTSSRAISNWQFNENFDVNAAELGTADFEVRHRFLANTSYALRWADRFTSIFSFVLESRSGSPFSWIYNGNANNDTRNDNDLVYVPASETDVTIEGGGTWEELDRFISAFDDLDEARGSVVERNSARTPWQNRLDFRFTQEIMTVRGQRVELTANIFNVLNLLNKDWGQAYFTTNDNFRVWSFRRSDANGNDVIAFSDGALDRLREDEKQNLFQKSDLASRWQLQLGARYTF